MKIRVLDGVLLIAAIVGGYFAVTSGQRLRPLEQQRARQLQLVGELTITDPTQAHVLALDTGDPLHFAWRVYLPAGRFNYVASSLGSGGSGSSSNSDPREFIARVRFAELSSGRASVYAALGSGSSHSTFGDPSFLQFLREHPEGVNVERLAANGLTRFDYGKPTVLLRVSLSSDLAEIARQRFPHLHHFQSSTVVYECKVNMLP